MTLFFLIFSLATPQQLQLWCCLCYKFLDLSFKWGKNVSKCDHRSFLVIYKALCHSTPLYATTAKFMSTINRFENKFTKFVVMHHHQLHLSVLGLKVIKNNEKTRCKAY